MTKWAEKILLHKSAHIITLTQAAKSILIQERGIAEDKITVIPCCVDDARFAVDSLKVDDLRHKLGIWGKIVVVYAGSVGGWYCLPEMVDWFREAKKTIMPDLHFLFLVNNGKDIVQKELGNMPAEAYTITSVRPEEMPVYLGAADLGIAFIIQAFSKKASSPIKYGEYLAAGLPLVANSGIGDVADLIDGEVGYLVSEFSQSEYHASAMHLKNLIEDWGRTSLQAKKRARNQMSIGYRVKCYLDVYRKMVFVAGVSR